LRLWGDRKALRPVPSHPVGQLCPHRIPASRQSRSSRPKFSRLLMHGQAIDDMRRRRCQRRCQERRKWADAVTHEKRQVTTLDGRDLPKSESDRRRCRPLGRPDGNVLRAPAKRTLSDRGALKAIGCIIWRYLLLRPSHRLRLGRTCRPRPMWFGRSLAGEELAMARRRRIQSPHVSRAEVGVGFWSIANGLPMALLRSTRR